MFISFFANTQINDNILKQYKTTYLNLLSLGPFPQSRSNNDRDHVPAQQDILKTTFSDRRFWQFQFQQHMGCAKIPRHIQYNHRMRDQFLLKISVKKNPAPQ